MFLKICSCWKWGTRKKLPNVHSSGGRVGFSWEENLGWTQWGQRRRRGGRGLLGAIQDPSLCILLPTSSLNAKAESPEPPTKSRRTHLSVPAHLEMWPGMTQGPEALQTYLVQCFTSSRDCSFKCFVSAPTMCNIPLLCSFINITLLCAFICDISAELLQTPLSSVHNGDSLVFSSSEWIVPHLIELGRLILGEISYFLSPCVDSYFSSISNHPLTVAAWAGRNQTCGNPQDSLPGLAPFYFPVWRTMVRSHSSQNQIYSLMWYRPLLPTPKSNSCWDFKWKIDWS